MKRFRKYFIPHEGNGYKPHFLRPKVIGFLCAMMVVAEVAFLVGPAYLAGHSKLFGIIVVNALVDGTNENRVANNVPALTVSPLLMAAAQEKANDMVANHYFAHTSPAGLTPWYWFENVGYDFTYAGENLAVNFSDSQDVTNAWMNSPEHRANILNPNFTQIGIATAQGTFDGQPAIYVVEDFGTPAAAAPIALASPISQVPARNVAPKTPIASVPTIVATNTPPAQESFAAVKGVETQTVPVAATVPQGITIQTTPSVTAPAPNPAPQNNLVQEAFASPQSDIAKDFFMLLVIVLVIALALNIFIQIRIQHPTLIMNGMFAIALAAVCIVLNQHALITHVTIF